MTDIGTYDNLTRADLDAITTRHAAGTVRCEDVAMLLTEVRRLRLAAALERQHRGELLDALRSVGASMHDLDPDAPIEYALTARGLAWCRRRRRP